MDILNILKAALENGLIWGLFVLGVYISYRVLDIADLSVEGTFPFGACLAALLIFEGVHPLLATILAVLGGVIVGIITGVLHAKLKIPAILAGIISMTGLWSINLFVLGLSQKFGNTLANLTIKNTVFKGLTELLTLNMTFGNVALWKYVGRLTIVVIFVVLVFVALYYFFGTTLGMAVRATGINDRMARAQGINTKRMIILGLAISNGLVALSGALLAQRLSTATVDMGRGTIVIGLASIIIGEAIFGKRDFKMSLISVLVGSAVYQLLEAVAVELNVVNYLKLVVAVIITIILTIPLIKPALSKKLGLYNKYTSGGNTNA
ncbi:MAG: ABC transporter permease [Bacilli bacterium]|nr:ABC transporter permease [Bacilli bacterium]